jgi:hypothetical protein
LVGADSGGAIGVLSPLWRRCRGTPFHHTLVSALREKSKASKAGDGGVYVATSLGALHSTVAWFLLSSGWWTSGQRPWTRWCVYAEKAVTGNLASSGFMGRSICFTGHGGQSCDASVAGFSARSTHLRGGSLTFRSGRRPQMLVQQPWSASVLPCAA